MVLRVLRFAYALLAGILVLVQPILYLDVNLVIMLAKESEYGQAILWLEIGTAIVGSIAVWRVWPRGSESQDSTSSEVGRVGQAFDETIKTIKGAALSKALGAIWKAFLMLLKDFRILAAGILLVFPGLITDSIGILILLSRIPPKFRRSKTDSEKFESSNRFGTKRLLAGFKKIVPERDSLFAEKTRKILSSVGSKMPGRANISSGLRAIPSRLSDLSRSKWSISYLKKRRQKMETGQKTQ